MMKWWTVVAVMLVGCSGRAQDPHPGAGSAHPKAVAPAAPEDPGKALAAKADQALAESMKLDYRRPFSGARPDRDPIRMMYFKACQRGDHRSCWMSTQLAMRQGAHDAYADEAEAKIRDNCVGGDALSCRAVSKPETLPGDPAHIASAKACGTDTPCDLAAVRQACKAGFPANCFTVMTRDAKAADVPQIEEVGRKLSREGCTAGILEECSLLRNFAPMGTEGWRADQLLMVDRLCTIAYYHCELAGIIEDPAEVTKIRDAFERACQFDDPGEEGESCHDAWRAYTDAKSGVTEPVPGRAKQLRDWVCEKDKVCWK